MNVFTKRSFFSFFVGSLVGLCFSYALTNKKNINEFIKYAIKYVTHKKSKKKTNNNNSIPDECPGLDSEHAGKSKVCEGCPNRKICNDPELKKEKEKERNQIFNEVQENLKNVKFKILILSGKGGVGKSTVAAQLAFALSYLNYEVGLLDIDICGPSIPVLTKTIDHDVNYSMNGWVPIYKNNLSIMSVGYLLPNFDDPVIWRGPKKNGLIKQFLCDVYWKNLDFLIIDTPPGTSDEHLTICSYLKDNLDGCIIVTTPHILSICDVKKEIEFCKKTNIPILGIVENMYQSIFVSNYTVKKMCSDMNVHYAGKVTFHQNLIEACQQGVGCCDIDPYSSSSKELFHLCNILIQQIQKRYMLLQMGTNNDNNNFVHQNSNNQKLTYKEEENESNLNKNSNKLSKYNELNYDHVNLSKLRMLDKLLSEINPFLQEKNE
ncbi:cytosolic Fe-S cluster assembly factor NBP35, putative [Plasmodium gaboni]|uniref:Cytosolic Fe-S cluster assembly factor NBP35, putative n=1 Tax=Plasmodium gaboni TaxID=647221 RepID=A0ABY1ULS1_9APIC|nr:cytosolic Fe-S cluster assembly factor NBP35, putative [Plasmodium gaboni]